jgi:hypothetical protein
MAIHIEGITVIVRQSALVGCGSDVNKFRVELGNKTFACDGSLARGALMSPVDVEDLVARLESWGLMYEVNGEARDIAVADQIHGLAIPAPWLRLFQVKLPGQRLILCARETYDVGADLVLPQGWKYEESLYTDLHFVPSDEETRILPLSRERGIDTVVDLASGQIVHRAAMVSEPTARSAKPPLSLATSRQDVFEREEKCIELVRAKAELGDLPMPEGIVPRKKWWRRRPTRKAVYDRPAKKTIHALAAMYGQSYRTEIMTEWVGILYGVSAGLHYSRVARSLLDQQGAANKRWLERNPDGPLPSRRPVSSDWLSLVDKELPSYDSEAK